VCEPLQIDPTKTGARYMDMAEEEGLITVDRVFASVVRIAKVMGSPSCWPRA